MAIDSFSNKLSQSIRTTLDDRINDLSRMLANTPAEDFAGYKMRVGHIQGLRDALSVVLEAEKLLSRPENETDSDARLHRRYED